MSASHIERANLAMRMAKKPGKRGPYKKKASSV